GAAAGTLRQWRATATSDIAVAGPAFASAALEDAVIVEHGAGRDRRQVRQARVERGEVRARGLDQLFEAVDDEIGLLEGVDAVARAHDPRQVEADAVGRGAFQRMERLALRRDDAAAVDA